MRLLLVEDNVPLADELTQGLQRQGYAVDWLADGRDAVYQGSSEPYDLIILDLGLPGLSGLEVLAQWRAGGLVTPVLILTARSSWAERIEGLKAGADDYLSKPFHPEELMLRVQSLLRRARGLANQPTLEAAGLQLDEGRQCVTRDGVDIQLTAAEFRLLRYFMLHPQQILSKSHLAEHLYDGETERDSNVLEVHVNHLRRKLGRSVIESAAGKVTAMPGVPSEVDPGTLESWPDCGTGAGRSGPGAVESVVVRGGLAALPGDRFAQGKRKPADRAGARTVRPGAG